MQSGDLLFFSGTDVASRLIQSATGGPYSHVAVAVSAHEVVEALGRGGIVRDLARPPARLASTGALLTPQGRADGLAWLTRQVGARYSWWDILADGLALLLPAPTPFLVAPSSFDCSDLAVRFLVHAGYAALPDALADCPQRVSPNALARALTALGVAGCGA